MPADDEKTKWNKRYASGLPASLPPEPFLVNAFQEFLAGRPPGYALDVAGGTGRHAIWLAQRGWRVKLIDISDAAVALARDRAAPLASQASGSGSHFVEAEVMNLNAQVDLGNDLYDLVVVFFFLQRSLFPALIRALKPGGILMYQTYTLEARRLGQGPATPEYLLRSGELLEAFRWLEILHHRESGSAKAAAELVARKPANRC